MRHSRVNDRDKELISLCVLSEAANLRALDLECEEDVQPFSLVDPSDVDPRPQ